MAKGRKRGTLTTKVLMVTLIGTLNLVGMSYAQWNHDLQINSTISTGYIRPLFSNNQEVLNFDSLVTLDKKSPNPEIDIPYQVKNEGTIPVEFVRYFDAEADKGIHVIGSNKDLKIKLTTKEAGEYQYRIKLLYQQKNN